MRNQVSLVIIDWKWSVKLLLIFMTHVWNIQTYTWQWEKIQSAHVYRVTYKWLPKVKKIQNVEEWLLQMIATGKKMTGSWNCHWKGQLTTVTPVIILNSIQAKGIAYLITFLNLNVFFIRYVEWCEVAQYNCHKFLYYFCCLYIQFHTILISGATGSYYHFIKKCCWIVWSQHKITLF